MKKQANIVSEGKNSQFNYKKLYRLDNNTYRMIFKPDSIKENGCFRIFDIPQNERAKDTKATYGGFAIDLTGYARYGVLTKVELRTITTINAEIDVFKYNYDQHAFGPYIGKLNCKDGVIDFTRFIDEAQEDTVFLAIDNLNSTLHLYNTFLEVYMIKSIELLHNQKYITFNPSDFAQVNVNVLSGTLFKSLSLFDLGGEGLPLSLSIFYNPADEEGDHGLATGFGPNYYTNYHQICLKEVTKGETLYHYFDSQRMEHVFRPVIGDDSLWVDTQGTGLLLRSRQNVEGVEIFDQDGNNFLFDGLGRLTGINWQFTDYLAVPAWITYVGSTDQISTINSMGHTASFLYEGSSVKIQLDNTTKVEIICSGLSMNVTFS